MYFRVSQQYYGLVCAVCFQELS